MVEPPSGTAFSVDFWFGAAQLGSGRVWNVHSKSRARTVEKWGTRPCD